MATSPLPASKKLGLFHWFHRDPQSGSSSVETASRDPLRTLYSEQIHTRDQQDWLLKKQGSKALSEETFLPPTAKSTSPWPSTSTVLGLVGSTLSLVSSLIEIALTWLIHLMGSSFTHVFPHVSWR